jgi:hypothetical protein
MSHINRRDTGNAHSDDQTWSYEVGSFHSSPSPRIVVQNVPTGSFATAQWAEERHAIKTHGA